MKSFESLKSYLNENKVSYEALGIDKIKIILSGVPRNVKEYILVGISNEAGVRETASGENFVIVENAAPKIDVEDSYVVTNVRPKGDRILVQVIPPEDMTTSGLHIPDSAKEKPQFGVVVAVGNKVPDDETKKGDKIIYGMWAGIPFTIGGEEYLLMRDSDVLAYV